ncbi:hypothetical protein [Streptomyces sp. MST-110588]|uniref:hypothetical protein n=1 Tax=Streptomyces sp. MST-110588 TaxID=2833628 RepID=UPI001F5C7EF0|nr:hypothetical protein [Streptomyces sp. MST-110588]UNO39689.1 hypothetical protein KGS77_08860 [Streptomyces sp. MST-110588]
MLFRRELTLERPVHRLGQLAHRRQQPLPPTLLLTLERGSQQLGPAHGKVVLESLEAKAPAGDQQQPEPDGYQAGIEVEHGLRHFSLVRVRVRVGQRT